MKRIFLIVLDSLGIGALPDAAHFKDEGSHTLRAILPYCDTTLPNLTRLGLFDLDGVCRDNEYRAPEFCRIARMAEQSAGKDTTIGHWEIAGLLTHDPLPTYPNGFPKELLDAFCAETGRFWLCNRPYSGTEVLRDFGQEHAESGKWIVYTSADSVFQIAAHEEIIPVEELYRACERARKLLCGEHAVGRVIARPFIGTFPHYTRTKNRHDYSLEPPKDTLLDHLEKAEKTVISIGKIADIFCGRGISKRILTSSNTEGMQALDKVINEPFEGLCFCNLVDFDMVYGHRNDAAGYAHALEEFDRWLGSFLPKIRGEDLLIITADHGCDPSTPSTDHSREYTPCLMYSPTLSSANLGTRSTFSDIAASVLDFFDLNNPFSHAKSMLQY